MSGGGVQTTAGFSIPWTPSGACMDLLFQTRDDIAKGQYALRRSGVGRPLPFIPCRMRGRQKRFAGTSSIICQSRNAMSIYSIYKL